MTSMIENVRSVFFKAGRDAETRSMMIMAIGLLLIAAPLDLGQLVFAVVGALCYAGLQASREVTGSRLRTHDKSKRAKKEECDYAKPRHRLSARVSGHGEVAFARRAPKPDEFPAGKREYRQQSSQPVSAPTFEAGGFDEQVQELLCQITPSAAADKHVQDIASTVQNGLCNLIPEADVMGFASADALRGTAFAVAIPEVDINISVGPSTIVDCLQSRMNRPMQHADKLDARRLQKAILRACTDELTSRLGFKFRRSAFKGAEPKVTLMADVNGKTTPIDLSVNTVTPLHNAALLTECGQIDARAKSLVLFVRRWAKDRGVSHAAKGHFSPYVWTLLTIYFLQVWHGEGEPVLPNIESFKLSAVLLRAQQKEEQSVPRSHRAQPGAAKASVAVLFREFIRFYTETFHWRKEAVSVRAGKRRPPAASLPLKIVMMNSGATDVAPTVEDPFAQRHNLSEHMTGVTLERLREEFQRAAALCSRNADLGELMEPWVPPEHDVAEPVHGEHECE